MKYIDYKQLNPFQKFGYNFKNFFINLPKNLKKFFCMIGRFFKNLFIGIGKGFAGYGTRFVRGDWATKLSYIIMGTGNIVRKQFVKGFMFLIIEIAYIAMMVFFGVEKLAKMFTPTGTIGTVVSETVTGANGRPVHIIGDNSMIILLYGVLTIILSVIFLVIYVTNTKSAYKAQCTVAAGEKPVSFMEELKDLLDNRFHVTLLAFPTLTISAFTILPLIFMILIAFTNFDHSHVPPGTLFSWVGFQTFADIFSSSGVSSKGATFLELTKWTLIWAVFATVLNYILGMIVALMINKKGIRLKALWRTLFVVTVAVPQFVSLLLMNQMLQDDGAINVLIKMLGMQPISFLNSTPLVARITVIVINCWVGIPYTILITSGILMNIPADLYESATIDGAGPARSFFSITLPYMLFVTTPYLITSFIGNINNFNVIYLLTNGGPTSGPNSPQMAGGAGYTDLLVTWLFKLTMSENDNNLAAAIGILVFIVCATLSLITFNLTKSAKNEEEFS